MQATFYLRRLVLFLLSFLVVLAAGFTALFFWVTTPPEPPDELTETTVSDVSRHRAVAVNPTQHPTTVAEIQQSLAMHKGPIIAGGARHSMGSQIAANALFIDMRSLRGIVSFSPEEP